MKTLIFILILLSFLETSVVSLDLVLMVILLRSYLIVDKTNLILALIFGFLISFLGHLMLGLESLIYLTLVQMTQLFSKSPFSRNFLAVVPVTLVLLFLHDLILSLIFHQSLVIFPKIFIEGLLILPIYIGVKFWEERFVVRPEVRLKIKPR